MPSPWDQDSVARAWQLAATAHNGQCLPGTDWPYLVHVGNVAMEAMAALTAHPVGTPINGTLVAVCALLHDTIEDTELKYERIAVEFGDETAQGVLALSKNPALGDKQSQMQDSLDRIKAQPREVWMVKLADRIVNLQPPPAYWTREKCAAYRAEAALILEALGGASPSLARRLAMKIEGYGRYTG